MIIPKILDDKKLQVLVVVFFIIALPLVVIAARLAVDLQLSADLAETPDEVIVANVNDISATICWYTTASVTGSVSYGTQPGQFPLTSKDDRDSTEPAQYNTHCARLKNLSPNSRYYFQINSGTAKFDGGATPYSFKTLPETQSLSTPDNIIGTISPAPTEGIVYAHASNGTKISTPVAVLISSGNYVLSKPSFRDPDTGELFDLSTADIVISVTDKSGARGTVQISGLAEKADDIVTSASGTAYNPNNIFPVTKNTATPTPTPTATVTSTPTTTVVPTTSVPTTSAPLGSINTASLLTEKVSYGAEQTNPTIPYSIFISNVSNSGYCVNWLTKEPTTGRLIYRRQGQSDKIVLDSRDSVSAQNKFYTHTSCINESNFNAGEKTGFLILTNNQRYGINLSTRATDYFVFALPQLASSPPSPESIQGGATLEYSTFSKANRDLLITGRFETGSGNSTWVSTVPANNSSNNWTLPFASIFAPTLSGYFQSSGANFFTEVHGEYNSVGRESLTSNATVANILVKTGLSVTEPLNGTRLTSLSAITGTGPSSSNITLSVAGQTVLVATDTVGRWSLNVSAGSGGQFTLNTQSGNDKVSLKFQVAGNGLPPTAIENWSGIISALFLLGMGIILLRKINSTRQKYSNN